MFKKNSNVLTFLLCTLVACILFRAAPSSAGEINQRSVVYIYVACENQSTGELAETYGSGFIIEKAGFVVTATHVISCGGTDLKGSYRAKKMELRLGSPFQEPPLRATIVTRNEQTDISILKILGASADYPVLRACSFRGASAGTSFTALGFPEGKAYQPIDVIFGNTEVEQANWSVASPFARGMSGGPVLYRGQVVGIINGGLQGVIAVRTVTPVYKAIGTIEAETGVRITDCTGIGVESSEVKTIFFNGSDVFLNDSKAEFNKIKNGEWIVREDGVGRFSTKRKIRGEDAELEYSIDSETKLVSRIVIHIKRDGSEERRDKKNTNRGYSFDIIENFRDFFPELEPMLVAHFGGTTRKPIDEFQQPDQPCKELNYLRGCHRFEQRFRKEHHFASDVMAVDVVRTGEFILEQTPENSTDRRVWEVVITIASI